MRGGFNFKWSIAVGASCVSLSGCAIGGLGLVWTCLDALFDSPVLVPNSSDTNNR